MTSARCRPLAPGLQVELHRADQPGACERSQQKAPAFTHGRDYALPVSLGRALAERQDEADRRAALDRVEKQLDQLGAPILDLARVKRP